MQMKGTGKVWCPTEKIACPADVIKVCLEFTSNGWCILHLKLSERQNLIYTLASLESFEEIVNKFQKCISLKQSI